MEACELKNCMKCGSGNMYLGTCISDKVTYHVYCSDCLISNEKASYENDFSPLEAIADWNDRGDVKGQVVANGGFFCWLFLDTAFPMLLVWFLLFAVIASTLYFAPESVNVVKPLLVK